MFEVNPVLNKIKEIRERTQLLRGYLDYDAKAEKLVEVSRELEAPEIWNDPERAQALGKERAALQAVVKTIKVLIRYRLKSIDNFSIRFVFLL